jgi:hypothetical protein
MRAASIAVPLILVALVGGCDSSPSGTEPVDRERHSSSTTSTTVDRAYPDAAETMTLDIGVTQVRNGDTVHVTGTGCVDPGTGLRAAFVRTPWGGSDVIGEDGTFAVDEVVPDSQAPGATKVMASCWRATDGNPIVISPPVAVTIETPYEASISSTRIARGGEFSFAADCPGTAEYHWSTLRFTAPDQTVAFEIDGPLGGGTVTMPTGITPGRYLATPTCEEHRGTRPLKYFQAFDVTVSA